MSKFRLPKKRFVSVQITIKRTYSNVFVLVSGFQDRPFKVFSSGLLGFKNTKKNTPYAAEAVGKAVGRYILLNNNNKIAVTFKSPIDGRIRAVIRGIASFGKLLFVSNVRSKFAPAHNGCRVRKVRRV